MANMIDEQMLDLLTKHQYIITIDVQRRPLKCIIKYPERVDLPLCEPVSVEYTIKYPDILKRHIYTPSHQTQDVFNIAGHVIRPCIHYDILISCILTGNNAKIIVPRHKNKKIDYEQFITMLRWNKADAEMEENESQLMSLFQKKLPEGIPPITNTDCKNVAVLNGYNMLRNIFAKNSGDKQGE